MIKVVWVKNPLNVAKEREVKDLAYVPDVTVLNYVKQVALVPEDSTSISINGKIIDDYSIIPKDGDVIVFCPKVEKKILAIIAMIAILYIAVSTGNMAAGKEFAAKGLAMAGKWKIGSYLAYAAVMSIGGALISNAFAPKQKDVAGSNTYNWQIDNNAIAQGSAIGITYGRVKIAGSIIGQHTVNTQDSDKQYLNLLLCGGEGEVDAITGIEINENPISYYGENAEVETRLGKNIQTVVSGFTETYADLYPQSELFTDQERTDKGIAGDGWIIQQTEGDGGSGLEVILECPGGLFYSKDNGSLGNATVKAQVEYRKVGDANWISMVATSQLVKQDDASYTRVSSGANPYTSTSLPSKRYVDYIKYTVLNLFQRALNKVTFSSIVPITQPVEDANWYIEVTGAEKRYSGGTKEENSYYAVTELKVTCSEIGYVGYANVGEKFNNGYISFIVNGDAKGFVGDIYLIKTNRINEDIVITAAKNTPIRHYIRKENIATGQYEVRCKCTFKSGTTVRYGTKLYFATLSHIIYDDFTYPNKVLVGMRALASQVLSGSTPRVTWMQERKNVLIFNPTTNMYELKPANNPAWASYDMMHRCSKLQNKNTLAYEYYVRGLDKSRMIYLDFEKWAKFCDDNKLYVNIYLDIADDLWGQLARVEELGRGKVIMRGTKVGCFFDGKADPCPVQLFTVSNIYQDTFNEDFLGLKDRANAVEISFFNADNGYNQETVRIYTANYNTAKYSNPTQKTLTGCTSREQAVNEGKYYLMTNENIVRTITIEADADAIACQVGDVVAVQHDVPQWGTGGRMISYNSSTKTIVLDKPVTFNYGESYNVLTRLIVGNDELMETAPIVNPATSGTPIVETDTITLTTAFSVSPADQEIFTFGKVGFEKKLFRVMSVARSKDFKYTISGIEYLPELYDGDNNYTDETSYSYIGLPSKFPPSEVTAKADYVIQGDGTVISGIRVNWKPASTSNPDSFMLYTSLDGVVWDVQGRGYGNSHFISGIPMGTYWVAVCSVYNGGFMSVKKKISGVVLSEKTIPPNDVQNFGYEVDTTAKCRIILSWDASPNLDIHGYEIRIGNEDWNLATVVGYVLKGNQSYSLSFPGSGQYNVLIKAKDTSENYSVNPSTILNLTVTGAEPAKVTGFTSTQLV